MEETILEGFLKPALSLICPHCDKSHKISADIKVKFTECTKCAKKIKIPESLIEMDNLLKNIHTLEIVTKELDNFKKLVIGQETEIKELKENKNYAGLLPANFKKVDHIVRKLQESMENIQEEINKCFENEPLAEEQEESGSSSNHNEKIE
jgi:hypothetical protein